MSGARASLDKAGRRSCISLQKVDANSKIGKMLHAADTSGDGALDVDELFKVFEDYAQQNDFLKYLKMGAMALFVLLVLMSVICFGVVWLAIDLQRDTQVNGGVMLDPKTNQPIQMGSSDFEVVEGVLQPRGSSDSSLKVGMHKYYESNLNSSWKDVDLRMVQALELTAPVDTATGDEPPSFLHAAARGIHRLDPLAANVLTLEADSAPPAPVVLFHTPLGRWVLSGDALVPAENFGNGGLAGASLGQLVAWSAAGASRRQGQDPPNNGGPGQNSPSGGAGQSPTNGNSPSGSTSKSGQGNGGFKTSVNTGTPPRPSAK